MFRCIGVEFIAVFFFSIGKDVNNSSNQPSMQSMQQRNERSYIDLSFRVASNFIDRGRRKNNNN